ncbi:hypothetical protein [Reyranella sp.]|jgi:hypothetical protein|uniref:hypothetical protein n=1 Tax=Reyranella sp. TaxID=1929291 RepID=UPI002F944786
MRSFLIAGVAALLVTGGGAVCAEQMAYSWTGMGVGTGKCSTYRMEIDVTVDGQAVKGTLKQQGRPERTFEAVADKNGMFRTGAKVGNGGTLEVSGSLKEGNTNVVLDGYCKFGGALTKQ